LPSERATRNVFEAFRLLSGWPSSRLGSPVLPWRTWLCLLSVGPRQSQGGWVGYATEGSLLDRSSLPYVVPTTAPTALTGRPILPWATPAPRAQLPICGPRGGFVYTSTSLPARPHLHAWQSDDGPSQANGTAFETHGDGHRFLHVVGAPFPQPTRYARRPARET
jgi:hypothetical protein